MGVFLIVDDEPPPRPLREIPGLLRRGVAQVWQAARGELLLQVALQVAGGLATLAIVLLGASTLRHLAAVSAGHERLADALPTLAGLAIGVAASGLATSIGTERQLLISELVARRQRERLMRIAGAVELAAFERPGFHDALSRAERSGMNGPVQLVMGLGSLGMNVAGLIGALAALAAIEPLLVALAVASVLPTVLVSARGAENAYRFAFRHTAGDRERTYLASTVTERETAAEIRAYELAEPLRDRWRRLADVRVRELRGVVLRQHLLSLGGALASALAIGGVLAALFALIDAGRIDGAGATAAGGALLLLGQRLMSAATGAGQLYEALLYVHDVEAFERLGVLETRSVPAAEAHAAVRPDPVAARAVTFTYPSAEAPALRGVDVSVAPGEVVALVGENGSGKTTLAKLLVGLYAPDEGSVAWGGVDLAACDAAALRPRAAIILQDHARWLLPAHDNIALGRHERADDVDGVRRAAREAGIDAAIERLPGGYDTILGPEFTGGSELSGGQWQRVAVARALFRDAELVVLDEPTAALDARAEHDLFARLRALLRGRAGVVISHRFSTVREADRIYVLHEGRIVEHGSHDELMARGGRYAELFTLQASAYR